MCVATHPARGADRESSRFMDGGRWTRAASGARRQGQGEMNLVRSGWRADGRCCLRTAKPCGPGRRCYGQALRRWIGAQPGSDASSIRKATVTKRIRRRGERGISRQPIAQGRPGVRPHLYAAVQCFQMRCAQRTAGAKPAPGLPCALGTSWGGTRRMARTETAARTPEHAWSAIPAQVPVQVPIVRSVVTPKAALFLRWMR